MDCRVKPGNDSFAHHSHFLMEVVGNVRPS
jgi:hypothetical protein